MEEKERNILLKIILHKYFLLGLELVVIFLFIVDYILWYYTNSPLLDRIGVFLFEVAILLFLTVLFQFYKRQINKTTKRYKF